MSPPPPEVRGAKSKHPHPCQHGCCRHSEQLRSCCRPAATTELCPVNGPPPSR